MPELCAYCGEEVRSDTTTGVMNLNGTPHLELCPWPGCRDKLAPKDLNDHLFRHERGTMPLNAVGSGQQLARRRPLWKRILRIGRSKVQQESDGEI